MKIETALNVAKKGYFLKDNKIEYTTITNIDINVCIEISDNKPIIKILYAGTGMPGTPDGGIDIKDIPEGKIFGSKKDLLASL